MGRIEIQYRMASAEAACQRHISPQQTAALMWLQPLRKNTIIPPSTVLNILPDKIQF